MTRGSHHAEPAALARSALARERHPVARLVSLMEDTRPAAAGARDAALAVLEEKAGARGHTCTVLGLTGTPGSGKSSLLSVTTREMLRQDPAVTIAVVAVDPSSPMTNGALLGDRTRMRTDVDERRLYFRSQASVTALGGLSPSTYLVCRALAALYDVVLVETVGIGQSEADIAHLADRVYLVLAPDGGDDVQLLKAGIVEIPDAFVVNKADAPGASRTYHQLRANLWLARPLDADDVTIHLASAQRGDGIPELAAGFLDHRGVEGALSVADRAPYFFERWVRDEWGRQGLRLLTHDLGGAAAFLADRGLGERQEAFARAVRAALRQGS